MFFRSAFRILGINLKHNFLPHLAVSLVIALLTPVIFGISALDPILSAQPLEMLLPLTGTVVLTPVFLPEQDENILALMRSKRTDYLAVCAVRVAYSIVYLGIIISGFVGFMKLRECQVTPQHLIGSLATALFLGSLGFLAAGISRNAAVGYMVSFIFYIANFSLKEKLGKLFLFSMSVGSFEEKYYLLAASVLMIAAAFLYLKITWRRA